MAIPALESAAVTHPVSDATDTTADPLAPAVARGALWREAYLACTPMLTSDVVAQRLGGLSAAALRHRVCRRTILSLPLGARRVFPVWQFLDGDRVVPGLALVRAALGTQSDWVFAGQLDDLRDPNAAAPRILRELLLAGDVTAAVRAAATYADEGGT